VVREEEDVRVKEEKEDNEGMVKKRRRRRTEEEVTVMEEEERVPMMINNNNPNLPTVVIKPRMMEKSTDVVRGRLEQEGDETNQEVSIRVADGSEITDKKTGAGPDGDGSEVTSLRAQAQSLNTRLCGPRPARMALLCTVLVSVWITWIFLIHLSVKLSVISESLTELQGDLKGAEEHLLEDRLAGQQALIRRLVEMARASQGSAAKDELTTSTLATTPSPSGDKTGNDRSAASASIPLHEEW